MTIANRLRAQARRARGAIVGVAGCAVMTAACAQGDGRACGALGNAYGPFDYRSDRGQKLDIVERHHFTSRVENLIIGESGTVAQELNYTLRAFPNHHRALLAAVRLGKRTKSPQPPGFEYSVDCFFDRAIRFRTDDTIVRMLFANYLFDNGRSAEADAQLERVDLLAADNPHTHYNVGVIYLERKNFDKALTQAKKAYALGFPRTELRDQLKALGKWNDNDLPTRAGAAASQSEAASASASDAKQ